MKERGIVTRVIAGNLAEVAFQKSDACAKCGACHAISEKMVGIEALNEVGAKKEDIVEIEIADAEIVKSSAIIYLTPILFLLGGYLAGAAIARGLALNVWEEAIGAGTGICSLVLSFFAMNWYDRLRRQRETCARIINIVYPRS